MSAHWAKLETQVVNDAFPLQRCVGSTDHSGVFLTQATRHAPSAVALKLIPFEPESSEGQLARWRAAVELSHPHLVRIFEVGECRLEGQDYLYARMEFADQTLEQLLERRALTEEEARDMLATTLGALEYLHRRDLVHGGLKPSNVLVVGNQLKLSSDTVRAMGDPDVDASAAADIRALGMTLCEALTRHRPVEGLAGLPAELPDSFRGIIARCLSPDPDGRPTVAELQAWLRGEAPDKSAATRLVIRVELPGEERPRAVAPERGQWRVLPIAAAVAVLAALAWAGYRMFSGSPPAAVEQSAPVTPPGIEAAPADAAAVNTEPPPAPPAAPPEPAVGEVMPVVSQSALDTIRGTVRVSMRVVVGADGNVIEASPDDPGPSRYFERRSLDAARKWTFPPADAQRRTLRIRFAFTRSGVTASAEPVP